ncbi:MAG TPA: hypothetical protein VF602_13575 [Pedobacter sp.]|jgi:hypothetical protein
MQVHILKQNSISASKRNLSATSFIIAFFVIAITATAMALIPGTWSLITGSVIIAATVRHLAIVTNRKPLLLEITDKKITYLSEENNQLITINSGDISGIDHKFCELKIHTKNDVVHHINLLNTGSEQNRWQIKEHVKTLTAGIRL